MSEKLLEIFSLLPEATIGGGLGNLAIRYGYYRFRIDVTVAAVIVILILVEIIQLFGSAVTRCLQEHR